MQLKFIKFGPCSLIVNLNHLLQENPLHSDEVINVAVPEYVKKLAEYMPTVPARVQANYLVWRFIKSLVLYMDKVFYILLNINMFFLNYLSILFLTRFLCLGGAKDQPRL